MMRSTAADDMSAKSRTHLFASDWTLRIPLQCMRLHFPCFLAGCVCSWLIMMHIKESPIHIGCRTFTNASYTQYNIKPQDDLTSCPPQIPPDQANLSKCLSLISDQGNLTSWLLNISDEANLTKWRSQIFDKANATKWLLQLFDQANLTTWLLQSTYHDNLKSWLSQIFAQANLTEWILEASNHNNVTKQLSVNLTSQLSEINEQLNEAVMRNKPPTEHLMSKIHLLFDLLDPQYKNVSAPTVSNDVCMEFYADGHQGWVTDKCAYKKPMHQLIEVLLYYPSCEEKLARILQGIRKHHPKLMVRIAVRSLTNTSCVNLTSRFNTTTFVTLDDGNSGVVWNRLVSMASTPYVLVGRDLDSFDAEFSSFSRQIRVLGTVPNVKVVGGAFRNQSGHWRVGCFQSDIRNYALKFQDGYFVSRNECMYCDHLLGPFVTLSNVLRKMPFNDSLPATVLFEDWFLQLRNKQMYVMNCPDVMYLATDLNAAEKETKPDLWIPLVRKWELNRLTWPQGTTHVFTCADAGITCENIFDIIYTRLMPFCCVEDMASKLGVIDAFFTNYSIQSEVFSGAVLGAVKMADFTPWDIDFDIKYPVSKRNTTVDAKEVFASHGLLLGTIDAYNIYGFCRLFTRTSTSVMDNFYFELLPYLNTPLLEYRKTKINFHGIWVNGPTNPGLYARNRYGRENLKHAQSWRHTRKDSEYEQYSSGHFLPCKSDHHACLDRYPADGSLSFKIN